MESGWKVDWLPRYRQWVQDPHRTDEASVRTEQRITVHLGPQPPVELIAALLEGTHLNYAILGGTGPTDRVLRIIVLPKAAGAPPGPNPNSENVAARARTEMHRAQTGGGEGVWDNNETEPSAQPPASRQREREH